MSTSYLAGDKSLLEGKPVVAVMDIDKFLRADNKITVKLDVEYLTQAVNLLNAFKFSEICMHLVPFRKSDDSLVIVSPNEEPKNGEALGIVLCPIIVVDEQ